jgi:tetratricopeptide (TPR) repeat protein
VRFTGSMNIQSTRFVDVREDYDQLVSEALLLTDSQDYRNALALWVRAYRSLPCRESVGSLRRAEVLQNAAVCACHVEEFETAMDYCETALTEQRDLVEDWSDDVQRTLAIYIDAATAGGEYDRAVQASDLALSALAENPEECEPYTFAMIGQKRACLALEMGRPDAAEEPLAFALEQLDLFFQVEELDAELEREVLRQKAFVLEYRAKNRLFGGAEQLGELDIHQAIRCLEQAGVKDGQQWLRLCGLRGSLAGIADI